MYGLLNERKEKGIDNWKSNPGKNRSRAVKGVKEIIHMMTRARGTGAPFSLRRSLTGINLNDSECESDSGLYT